MAEAGTVEASPVDDQRLCWAMRRAERGRDYEFIGYEWLGNIVKFDQYRSLVGVGCPVSGCRRDVGPASRIP